MIDEPEELRFDDRDIRDEYDRRRANRTAREYRELQVWREGSIRRGYRGMLALFIALAAWEGYTFGSKPLSDFLLKNGGPLVLIVCIGWKPLLEYRDERRRQKDFLARKAEYDAKYPPKP